MKLFIRLYDYFKEHTLVLWLSLTLLVATCIGLSLRLHYKEDISEFLPSSPDIDRITYVYQQMGGNNKIYLFFDATDAPAATGASWTDSTRTADNPAYRACITQAMDAFETAFLAADTAHLCGGTQTQVDEESYLELPTFMLQHAPLYLTAQDYARIDTCLTDAYIERSLARLHHSLSFPNADFMIEWSLMDPLNLFMPTLKQLQALRLDSNTQFYDGYMFMDGGRSGVMHVTTTYGLTESKNNARLVALLDDCIARFSEQHPEVRITCIGGPVIAVSNASRIKQDSILTLSIASVLILLLLLWVFRNLRNILLIVVSLTFGVLFALASMALYHDSISIIIIGIGSVFIGIAVNYPLHLIDHLNEQPNVRQALREIVQPLLVGNITTVGAFLSLVFMNASAMRDLGAFGCLMLIGTIAFVLVVLPHLVKTHWRPLSMAAHATLPPLEGEDDAESHWLKRMADVDLHTRLWLLPLVLLITAVLAWFSQYTTFDPDMRNINYMTPDQRTLMAQLSRTLEQPGSQQGSRLFCVAQGATLQQTLQSNEALQHTIDSCRQQCDSLTVAGMGRLIPSVQQQRQSLAQWDAYWASRRDSLWTRVHQASLRMGFADASLQPFHDLLYATHSVQPASYFAPFTQVGQGHYLLEHGTDTLLVSILTLSQEQATALKERVNAQGASCYAFEPKDVNQRITNILSDDFNYVGYVCGFIVFLFLTLSFGRMELSLLSFLPLAVGWIWILGIMGLSDLHFNIINIILATFIFGQGDDYTIFITEGLIYEYAYGRKILAAYKKSVIVSALIMLIGIGTLVLAKHPAMFSLGVVSIIGMFTVVLMAYYFPPLVFHWMTMKHGQKRDMPLTLRRLGYSIYSFAVFFVFSLYISTAGRIIFGFTKDKARAKLRFHTLLQHIFRRLIHCIPGITYKQLGTMPDMSTPRVIICNHQSHFDLLCLLALSPKIVVLTNQWVWNSPFYGRIIRYADFLPVSEGIENAVTKLSEVVKAGYSIAVFPEGTRSADGSIARFHRGAFYLAEQLGLDILPIVLHGLNDVLPKTDFLLRQGQMTASIEPVVPYSQLGANYREAARAARKLIRERFEELCSDIEHASYFVNKARHLYLYKGKDVYQQALSQLRDDALLQAVDAIPATATHILVPHNGVGVAGLLVAWTHPHAEVYAVESDPDLYDLSTHCAGLPGNLKIAREESSSLRSREEWWKLEYRVN